MVTLTEPSGAGLRSIEDDARRRDATLVRRCRRGDEAAWTALVERFADYVYAILTRGFGLDATGAEDVFQEVFTRAFRRLNTLDDDCAIRPWIAQLARRAAIDRLRGTRTEADVQTIPEIGAGDPAFELTEQAVTMQRALAELPDTYGEVIERFFIRDQSYHTIGCELGLPLGTVASRISRGLTMLRVMLEDQAEALEPAACP
jgi:RNA polymerase sigma factor (sigma-70 family)